MKLYGIVYQILDKLNVPVTEHNVTIVTGLIRAYRQEILDTYISTHEQEDLSAIPSSAELHGGYFDRYKE